MWLKPDIKCRHENIDHIEAFRTQPTKFESSDLQVEYVTFVDENMKYNAILLNGATQMYQYEPQLQPYCSVKDTATINKYRHLTKAWNHYLS